jgi:O-antigen/teichoic acid export membrane protein
VQLSHLQYRSYVSRYLLLIGGETFSKLCVIAAFAFLTHVLSPGDYGTVELALSITVFFVLGVESGMGLYGARVIAASPERIPSLVAHVMLLRVFLGLPAFALILAVSAYYRFAGLGILAVNGVAVLLTPFLVQWVFQGLRQMQWVAAGTVLRNFTFVALVLLLVRPGSDIRLVAVAEVSGIALLAVFSWVLLRRRLHVVPDWRGAVAGTGRLFRDVWFMGFGDFTWACLWFSPALIVGWLGLGMERVAWVAASVRVVISLHTFVFLYFFNMLPNMARELASGLDGWRDLVMRSMTTSIWPGCLAAVGGTLIAPVLMPLVFGPAYAAAVRPFQIIVWMIPVAWFSGHFRFSLIAAGQQRWEFLCTAGGAVVTVSASVPLALTYGSSGAAVGLLAGGVANTAFAMVASHRRIGAVPIAAAIGPALATAALCLAIGLLATPVIGTLAGTTVACLVYVTVASRQDNELVALVRAFLSRRPTRS